MNEVRSVLALCAAWVCSLSVGAQDVATLMRDADAAYARADVVAALAAYRRAAEAGHPRAQLRLGQMLDGADDDRRAIQWYRRAAASGLGQAQHALGRMYAAGEGIEQDLSLALKWFTQAANGGHPPAIRVLATAYELGDLAVEVDYDAARLWLLKGLEVGDHWSIERMARAYQRGGLGFRVDTEAARLLRERIKPAAGREQ